MPSMLSRVLPLLAAIAACRDDGTRSPDSPPPLASRPPARPTSSGRKHLRLVIAPCVFELDVPADVSQVDASATHIELRSAPIDLLLTGPEPPRRVRDLTSDLASRFAVTADDSIELWVGLNERDRLVCHAQESRGADRCGFVLDAGQDEGDAVSVCQSIRITRAAPKTP